MFKKITLLIIFIAIVVACCIPSFAVSNSLFNSANTPSSQQFLVTITRPEGDESTFKTSYVICGNTNVEGIEVELYIYNKDTDSFEPFLNTDGVNSWEIGSSGIFMKEVVLPEKGVNKIRIVAYKKGEAGSLELNSNLQINDFNITVLNEDIKEMIENGMLRINDLLKGFFN